MKIKLLALFIWLAFSSVTQAKNPVIEGPNQLPLLELVVHEAAPDHPIFKLNTSVKNTGCNRTNTCTVKLFIDQNTVIVDTKEKSVDVTALAVNEIYYVTFYKTSTTNSNRISNIKLGTAPPKKLSEHITSRRARPLDPSMLPPTR